MSWDVMFMDLPKTINRLDEIPEDFEPGSLCSRDAYEKMVFELFPDIDENDDRSWMSLTGDGYSIEFSAGSDDPVESLVLHVRGREAPMNVIKKICDYTGWKAIDTTLGIFLDFDHDPGKGFYQWKAFRDRVVMEYATAYHPEKSLVVTCKKCLESIRRRLGLGRR